MNKHLIFQAILAFILCHYSLAQSPKLGAWRGVIKYDSVDVPFNFQLERKASRLEMIVKNGDELISLSGTKTQNDSLYIPLVVFDVQLVVKAEDEQLNGYWQKNYRNSKVPFSANFGKERFESNKKTTLEVSKKWQMTFKPGEISAYSAIGLWQQKKNIISGTILTGVSDFRYFEGILSGDSIKASSFDGAHAFLIRGKRVDGVWKGVFHFDNGYNEDWVARPDEDAEIEKQYTKVKSKTHRPYYDILAAGSGGEGAIDESKYFNKVLIIQLFGTWCPNSLDATRFLQKWYEENKSKDVEILAVTYEPNYSREYGEARIADYSYKLGIDYDVILGGRLSKSQAALAFPFMSKIEAFPTLVIVDKEGFVHSVFNYFNGPATNEYYEAFEKQFEEVVENLLNE